MTSSITVQPHQLPATIRSFLAAHHIRDIDAAARAFSSDAVVVDEGRTYRGSVEIGEFLGKAGAQYSYTTELIGAQRLDEDRWVATNRLEGDFPGGVVELDFRFTLDGPLVAELVIAPR